jgi:hypothetical protein
MLVRMLVLAVNTVKIKYMDIGCPRGKMANEHINVGRKSYKKVKTFKYLGSSLTNKNYIHSK